MEEAESTKEEKLCAIARLKNTCMEQAEEHIRKQKKYVCKQAVCIRDTVVGAIKAFGPYFNHICLEKWGIAVS